MKANKVLEPSSLMVSLFDYFNNTYWMLTLWNVLIQAFHMKLSHLTLSTVLWSRKYYFFHSADEETEA